VGVQWRMALFTQENGEKARESQSDLKHIIAFSFDEDSHQKLTNRDPTKNRINGHGYLEHIYQKLRPLAGREGRENIKKGNVKRLN